MKYTVLYKQTLIGLYINYITIAVCFENYSIIIILKKKLFTICLLVPFFLDFPFSEEN